MIDNILGPDASAIDETITSLRDRGYTIDFAPIGKARAWYLVQTRFTHDFDSLGRVGAIDNVDGVNVGLYDTEDAMILDLWKIFSDEIEPDGE